MRRGEVWWFEPPHRKRRPVCILTRNEAIGVRSRVVVVEATTTVRGIPSEVRLDTDDGMPRPCVLVLDSLVTVRKALLTGRITELSPVRMHAVCRALVAATGCEA
jgi:mRNA interferase MazF